MWGGKRNLPDQVVFSIFWFRYEVVCEDVGLLSLQWAILQALIFTEVLLIHPSMKLKVFAIFHEYQALGVAHGLKDGEVCAVTIVRAAFIKKIHRRLNAIEDDCRTPQNIEVYNVTYYLFRRVELE